MNKIGEQCEVGESALIKYANVCSTMSILYR